MAGIWNGEEFLAKLMDVRAVWAGGPMGSGKTLLMVAIADHLASTRVCEGVVANIPHNLPAHPWREKLGGSGPYAGTWRGIDGAAVLFDEAGTTGLLDNRTFAQNDTRSYGGYARKLHCVFLLPSVIKVDNRMTGLVCQRTWKLPNLWLYKWAFVFGEQEGQSGMFGLVRPSRYFGRFDTGAIPDGDAGISNLFEWTVAQRARGEDKREQWFAEVREEQEAIERQARAEIAGRNKASVRGAAGGVR